MRIIKMYADWTADEFKTYIEEKLPGLKHGKFTLGKRTIAQGGLGKGERLLFCHKGIVRYAAEAESKVSPKRGR